MSEVDHILAAKNHDPAADTTEWEREIDRLVASANKDGRLLFLLERG